MSNNASEVGKPSIRCTRFETNKSKTLHPLFMYVTRTHAKRLINLNCRVIKRFMNRQKRPLSIEITDAPVCRVCYDYMNINGWQYCASSRYT